MGKTDTLPHTLSQPVETEAPGIQRPVAQPGTDDVAESIWGLGIPVSSGATGNECSFFVVESVFSLCDAKRKSKFVLS